MSERTGRYWIFKVANGYVAGFGKYGWIDHDLSDPDKACRIYAFHSKEKVVAWLRQRMNEDSKQQPTNG